MDIATQLLSLSERRNIEDSRIFSRQSEKSQVLMPQHGRDEVTKNRSTHSYEVATSALSIAAHIALRAGVSLSDIDYQASLYNACLLHDIGQPPFAHQGSKYLNTLFKGVGVPEGFCDNNNSLVAIKKNNLKVREYTLASIIKYPFSLYPYQRKEYLTMLHKAINEDREHYKALLGVNLSAITTTIACMIMDEADRNSYTFSDMSDFLCMGNKLNKEYILKIADGFSFNKLTMNLIHAFLDVANSGNKSDIKSFLSDLKDSINSNYQIKDAGLVTIDPELLKVREFINKLNMNLYVKPTQFMTDNIENEIKFGFVINEILNERFLPSNYYKNIILSSQDELTKLRAMRDMVAETSDWYILTQFERIVEKKS